MLITPQTARFARPLADERARRLKCGDESKVSDSADGADKSKRPAATSGSDH